MIKITALHDTYFKKTTQQASELSEGEKHFVEKGVSYSCQSLEEKSNHFFVELSYGAGTWYGYTPHWDVEGVEKKEKEHQKKTVNAGAGFRVESIDWKDFNCPISTFFTVGEVTQWDVRRIPISNEVKANILALAKELDKVRAKWGSPIQVTSWYRPPAVNRAVGGATRSQHLTGSAVDIFPSQGNIYDFQEWLDEGLWRDRALGYGASRDFVHCDLRHRRIRWYY